MSIMPGGGISTRPLHFIVLADTSRSMMGERIQALNHCVPVMIDYLKDWERDQDECQLLVRVLTFGESVNWHVGDPTPIDEFVWRDLKAAGSTPMGEAIRIASESLANMESRALAPWLWLITDGVPNDEREFESGLRSLLDTRIGRASLRLGMAIGTEADESFIARFIDNPDIPVLHPNNTDEIGRCLLAMSIAVSRMSIPGSNRATIAEDVLGSLSAGASDDDSII